MRYLAGMGYEVYQSTEPGYIELTGRNLATLNRLPSSSLEPSSSGASRGYYRISFLRGGLLIE
jgi:hypothetical protein